MLFSGKGYIPQELNTETELIEYVARTDGAIGYISYSCVDKNIKTMAIIED